MTRSGESVIQTILARLMTRSRQAVSQRVPNWDDSKIGTGRELKSPNTCMYSYYNDVYDILGNSLSFMLTVVD